jgi:predicted RecB family nuclease
VSPSPIATGPPNPAAALSRCRIESSNSMFSATDIASFLACRHTATLARAESKSEISKPFFKNQTIDLLRTLGLEHEQRYLRGLAEKGLSIAQIATSGNWKDAVAETVEALRQGVDAVYQATYLDGQWGGRSDFLLRVNTPSALGSWSYEVVETKLARSTKATALVQLCFYSDLLARIQGMEPQWMHVVLGGTAIPERFQVPRYIAYFRKIRGEYQTAWKTETDTYPEPVEHCDVCSWFSVCNTRRREDDHSSLIAGISRNQRKALAEHSVSTVAELAELTLPPIPKIERIGSAALLRIREQARLQVQGRGEGRLIYELLDGVEDGNGLAALPAPSSDDLFLDLESNPYVLDQGLEYLIGIVTPPAKSGGEPVYETLWSFTRSEEKRAFETFIAKVIERWRRNPEMHIYHYAPYEPTAIKRLVGRHGTCVDEVDELLRAGVFVDLYRAVRQGIRASVESYSIKRLEPLYGFTRMVPLRDANFALQSYEAAMALGHDLGEISDLLKTIEGYNRDDCLSALRLRDWLEDRREDLGATCGRELPRPTAQSGQPPEKLSARLVEIQAIMARLIVLLPADETEWKDEHRAIRLLAQMLEWHQREEKSAWWEYFRFCALADDELEEDKSALGGLVCMGEVGRLKRSIVYRYTFPPQDHAIDRALEVRDPRTGKSAGERVAFDERNRTIDLKRGASSSAPHPTSLIPFDIVDSKVLSDSILRIASHVADHGITGSGKFQSARKLLLRERSSVIRGDVDILIGGDEQLTEAAKNLTHLLPLQPSVLPIQGPPGSGKTFTGARMIVELVRQGRRVGITAVSHKVIGNLLDEVCRTAAKNGISLKAVQKASEGSHCQHAAVIAEDNQGVLDALTTGSAHVAGGSAWMWAREDMADSVDVLFVDEAGQMSLANVLALSPAATSIVLLGDPQQLDQPQKGLHPLGAEVSALGHLLNGRATIAADQGVFLTETRRLHPDVCAFTSELFYEGRLTSRPENAKQRLNAGDPLGGTGLRFAPVEHTGNQNESPEEVERVAAMIEGLLRTGATWADKEGKTNALGLQDILIVAPYNAHVSALTDRLPTGSRVGTVDKFQGQQAAAVFYSMATSTPEDAPRGMEFLYSLNRLNVAVSRARCVAVIVASPALFQVQCKTPRQMELANAFCRYLEMARTI